MLFVKILGVALLALVLLVVTHWLLGPALGITATVAVLAVVIFAMVRRR